MKPDGARRKRVARARKRILTYAWTHGAITNAQARKIARLPQVYFHLKTLADAKLLKHAGFNEWVPRNPPGRPRLNLE